MRMLCGVVVFCASCQTAPQVEVLNEQGGLAGAFTIAEAPPPVWFSGQGHAGLSDQDGDGIVDLEDNCPGDFNESQLDMDGNGLGDVCDDMGMPMDEFPDPNLVGFETFGKWQKTHLTWALEGWPEQLTYEQGRAAIAGALEQWSEHSGLTFEQIGSADKADMVLGMRHEGDHGDECPFGSSTIAHSFFPNENYPVCPLGELHFNDTYAFTTAWRASSWEPIDYQSLALHEIGHALGLAHSANNKAVMWKFYVGSRRTLHDDDVAGIQALYGGPPECQPNKTCADYAGQCGLKSDGCDTTLNCGCGGDDVCIGSKCIDPCAGVDCGQCQVCDAGQCGADASEEGATCDAAEGAGACEDGACIYTPPLPDPEPDPLPEPEPPPVGQWIGEPFWSAICAKKGDPVKLCVETTGHQESSLNFVIYEADSQWYQFVTQGTTVIAEKQLDPLTGRHKTCMTWPAWWTSDGGGDPEFLLKVTISGFQPVYMPANDSSMLHVGRYQTHSGSYCNQ